MKSSHLILIVTLVLISITVMSQDKVKSGREYISKYSLINPHEKIKGITYDYTDSTVTLIKADNFSKNTVLSNYKYSIFPIENIDVIKARKRGRIWVGTAAGFAAGALTFGLISNATADKDAEGMNLWGAGVALATISGSIVGAGLGAAFSSIQIIIPVNGNRDQFKNSRSRIEKISLKN